jgi:sugar lactone lactonase YvrE
MQIRNANPIAVDLQNIYISNFDAYRAEDTPELNHAILKFGSSPRLLAGQTESGFQDGPANQASFNKPTGVVSHRGNLYVLDQGNNAIRKVDAQGNVTTFASEGRGFKAPLDRMSCFTIDSTGRIYVVKRGAEGGDVIRITSAGEVTEFKSLLESSILSIAVDDSGILYATIPAKQCIYKAKLGVDESATILAGDERESGDSDGTGIQARFYEPHGLVVGTDGNIYVADFDNHLIRKVTPQGVVTTLAGNGNGMRMDGIGVESSLYYPMYLAWHPRDMILYVVEGDDDDLAIRYVDADTGAVATIYSNDEEEQSPVAPAPPVFLTPPASPPSKDIEAGSGDVISSDDIEEGSVVGQIIGEGGTIAKSQYYFPASLQNLWQQGPSKFTDPYTRKKIVDVKWYKAHLVPAGSLGGRRTRKFKKVKKSRKIKRSTYRKKRRTTRKR